MSFIAILQQDDEGCDYTIACGTKVIYLNANTMEEAIAELDNYEDNIDVVTFYGDGVTCDIYETTNYFDYKSKHNKIKSEKQEEFKKQQAIIEKEKKRALYEELKKEFN